MSNVIEAKDIFAQGGSVADLRLLCCPGAEELTNLIDRHLMRWAAQSGMEQGSFIIPCECPRFQSGDAKGLVKDSVRGDDIFIVDTACRSLCPACTAAVSTAAKCARALTALWLCRSYRIWA